MPEIVLEVIATVRNGREDAADRGWGSLVSTIELLPEFAEGLEGLESFSHALVLFHMHRDPDREPPTLKRRPRGRADMPLLGVFARTRWASPRSRSCGSSRDAWWCAAWTRSTARRCWTSNPTCRSSTTRMARTCPSGWTV